MYRKMFHCLCKWIITILCTAYAVHILIHFLNAYIYMYYDWKGATNLKLTRNEFFLLTVMWTKYLTVPVRGQGKSLKFFSSTITMCFFFNWKKNQFGRVYYVLSFVVMLYISMLRKNCLFYLQYVANTLHTVGKQFF